MSVDLALLCHGCEQAPIRPEGPPATRIEVWTGQRMYCLTCLLEWNRKDDEGEDA